MYPPNVSDSEVRDFKNTFNSFDANGDGVIDSQELMLTLQSLGEPHDLSSIQALMSEVDSDNSGDITFDEFVKVISQMRAGKSSAFSKVYSAQEFSNKNEGLRFAAKIGSVLEVQEWIKKGADPSMPTSYGNTALHLAAQEGKLDVVQYLCTKEKKVKPLAFTNHGETALHYAAQWGHLAVCKFLIESAKCEPLVLQEDLLGFTPLDYAKFRKHQSTFAYLESVAIKIAGGEDLQEKRVRFKRIGEDEDDA